MRHGWIGLCGIGMLLLAACGGNGGDSEVQAWAYRDLGELEDAIDSAPDKTDSDGDSIPDAIELELGTDPMNKDSDFDGLVDNYELFEAGFSRSDPLPDKDRDGLIASADADEDGDRINDGVQVDTDGDGVANYLEYYGYTYDFLTGEFSLWNGDPAVAHFFTDPLQPSTDQDAYPDGMEVSGLLLDPTVRAPGNDPLVPAYPNLVVELASYSVTLNEEIQLTETESIDRGRSWTRQTDRSHSYTNEINWGVGVEIGYEAGKDPKVTGKVSANLGGSYASTNSVAVSVGTGESVTTSEGWSVARTSNPTEAAHLKLFLKVRNRGTAPISNIVPTLTLKIGGLNVTTFEPGNPRIHMLVPGAEYPEEPGVYWVVDSIDGGGPLTLTMSELRALERGAPISVSVTQVAGDAMRLTTDASWESVGATSEFVARCDAVCANLRIDLGDGELVHHLVYSDDAESARPMTLGEALRKIGVDEEGTLSYVDRNGNPRMRSLDGFKYAVDPETLRANGWTVEPDGTTESPPEFALHSLRLLPDSNVLIRAPRDPAEPPEPLIYFGYLDPYNGDVRVSAGDYEGIVRVRIHDEADEQSLDLSEEVPGAGFYGGRAKGDDAFVPGETLYAEVLNLAGNTSTIELGRLFREPEPQPPLIHAIEVSLSDHRIYVNVESGNPNNANSNVAWVRVFHPDLNADGFLELDLAQDRVANYYEDENGLEKALPNNFVSTEGILVVAYVSPGVYTEQEVDPADVENIVVLRSGTITMQSDWDDGPDDGLSFTSRIGRLTLDAPRGSSPYRFTAATDFYLITSELHPIPGGDVDLVLRVENGSLLIPKLPANMYMRAQYVEVGDGNSLYRSLTKGEIEVADFGGLSPLAVGQLGGFEKNKVYAIRTTKGLYAKIYVEDILEEYYYFQRTKTWKVKLKYTVWE